MKKLASMLLVTFVVVGIVACGGANINKAVKKDDMNKVKEGIAQGQLNEQGKYGHTPVIVASYYNNPQMVKFLCEQGADVNIQSKDGSTALIYAAAYGYSQVVRELIEHGADTGLKDSKGNDAIHYAKRGGYTDLVEVLQSASN